MGTVLDLSSADASGLEPFKGGLYPMGITKCSPVEIKNESGEGKYPAGTGGYNVEFTVQEGEFEGRKVWNNYWILPEDYIQTLSKEDQDKARFANGRFVRLLVAAGIEESEIKSGSFDFNPGMLTEPMRKVMANVGIQPAKDGYDARNTIRDVKPYQNATQSGII